MNPRAADEYDFIVVGAGTAGCVIAARLSKGDGARVLLLEAGGREPLEAMAVPPAWPSLEGTSADWADTTVAQTASGTTMRWARGRGLGGSSAINGMIFMRGHRSSYDTGPVAGRHRLGIRRFAAVPAAQRARRGTRSGAPWRRWPAEREARDVTSSTRRGGIGGGGRVGVPGSDRHQRRLGGGLWLVWSDDRRGQTRERLRRVPRAGAGAPQPRADDRRFGAPPAGARWSLRRLEYSVGSEMLSARCRGEVVLAAGTVGSPLVLMRSGIGPEPHLRKIGVDVILDLPGLGQNLQDHVAASVVYRSARPMAPAANNHGEVLRLVRSDPALDAPDLQILFVDVALSVPSLPSPDQGYALLVSLMAPHSRGSAQLRSAEPQTGPGDIDALVAGLDLARVIGRAKALDPWRSAEVHPGPDARSGDSLRAYLRRALQSYHHPVGTCRSARTTGPYSTPSCAYAELADYAWPTPLCRPLCQATPWRASMASPNGRASLMQE